MKQKIIFIAVTVIVAVWGISLVAAKIMVPEHNPPEHYAGMILGTEADKILVDSCFDCHSNQSNWPWYSYMPVVSALVAHDVEEGRKELNFSLWDKMTEQKRIKKMDKALEEVMGGDMPLTPYVWTHSNAEITPVKIAVLRAAAQETLGIVVNESADKGDEGDDDED
ncbi:MAG: heme-binding domain-containing protein [SAR324 cluster bacterium]|nr:heme-binding domain-containing protein [SAR324 cluster bacterium]